MPTFNIRNETTQHKIINETGRTLLLRTLFGSGGSGGSGTSSTTEALAATVDPAALNAADPVPGVDVFATQNAIDSFLATNNTTAFKSISPLMQVLPPIIAHNVVITAAAGVHRPATSGESAINTGIHWILPGVTVTLQGATSANYTQIVAAATVSSVDNTGDNPRVNVSGTPYAGQTLDGMFAVFDTGLVTVIHDHTDSQLSVLQEITGAPTTVTVMRPGSFIRNSVNDTSRSNFVAFEVGIMGLDTFPEPFLVNDFQIDAFGGTGLSLAQYDSSISGSRLLFDHEYQRVNFSISPNGRDINLSGRRCFVGLDDCSGYADAANMGGRDDPMALFGGSQGSVSHSYFGNSTKGIKVQEGSVLTWTRSVYHNLTNTCVELIEGSRISHYEFTGAGLNGKRSEIRNTDIGIQYGAGCGQDRNSVQRQIFSGCTGPCIDAANGSFVDVSASSGAWLDGGGNTDVGVQVAGSFNHVMIDANTNATGTAGDIRIDGVVDTYANVAAASPVISTNLNRIEKA